MHRGGKLDLIWHHFHFHSQLVTDFANALEERKSERRLTAAPWFEWHWSFLRRDRLEESQEIGELYFIQSILDIWMNQNMFQTRPLEGITKIGEPLSILIFLSDQGEGRFNVKAQVTLLMQ